MPAADILPQCPSRRQFLVATGIGGASLIVLRAWGAPAPQTAAHKSTSIVPFQVDGDRLVVPVATYRVPGRSVQVTTSASLQIDPADVLTVRDEALLLANGKPSGVFNGTMLKSTIAYTIGAFNSLIEESLTLRDGAGRLLSKGDDYLVSAPFALLGIGSKPSITPTTSVYASYSYYTQRIDTVVVDAHGVPHLVRGTPRLMSPEPPPVAGGATLIGTVYRPFRGTRLEAKHVFPIKARGKDALTATSIGQIPKTLGKLQRGEPVTILCWGDSITVGADVNPDEAWANLLHTELTRAFPRARITHKNRSIGGSKTAHWLNNGVYPGLKNKDPQECRFDHVLNDKPDLVVMEFLNDVVLQADAREQIYRTISEQFRARGIEWIIVTPSHLIPPDFDLGVMRSREPRPLDTFLQRFAADNNYALADASARWRHLQLEGIPFFSLFNNCYNHPNAYGHRLFVEEIMKCFHA